MTFARGVFYVLGTLVEIKGEVDWREDVVRLSKQTMDLRHRAWFPEWSANLVFELNESVMSFDQLCNLVNIGGFSNGIGEWRPEKNGEMGRFRVAA